MEILKLHFGRGGACCESSFSLHEHGRGCSSAYIAAAMATQKETYPRRVRYGAINIVYTFMSSTRFFCVNIYGKAKSVYQRSESDPIL